MSCRGQRATVGSLYPQTSNGSSASGLARCSNGTKRTVRSCLGLFELSDDEPRSKRGKPAAGDFRSESGEGRRDRKTLAFPAPLTSWSCCWRLRRARSHTAHTTEEEANFWWSHLAEADVHHFGDEGVIGAAPAAINSSITSENRPGRPLFRACIAQPSGVA